MLAALATFVAIMIYGHATARPLIVSPAGTNMYASRDYGYSFTYPAAYRANEYAPHFVSLSDPMRATNADLVTIAVAVADTGAAQSFASFAHAAAERYCEADGPRGSQSCTGITRSESFTTRMNLSGEFFYLRLVSTVDGARSEREAGPFWAFDISPNVPKSRHAALLIFPMRFAEESVEYDTGAALAQTLVDSLQIQKVAR